MRLRKLTGLAAAFAALLVSGCATFDPVEQPPEYTPPPAISAEWEALGRARPGDWYALLNDGPVAIDWRLRAIDSATESIDLQTFLWTFDKVGAAVLDHLLTAAERGVQVRLLIDDSFLFGEDAILLEIVRHPNIEYRVFNPYVRRTGGFASREALNLGEFRRLDHRMHNKAMVVDNRVAIVGGRNLADEYFGLHDQANFRDLEVIVGGPVVLDVSQEFDRYWNDRWAVPIESLSHVKTSAADLDKARSAREGIAKLHAEETAETRLQRWKTLESNAFAAHSRLLADDPPAERPGLADDAPVQVANVLTELFDTAESEIIIVSAYLIPTQELLGAVERAVQRGVRVRMLTNSIRSNNHPAAHSAYRAHITDILDRGGEMHEIRVDASDRDIYMLAPVSDKQLALHAKALIVDRDKVFIGSANLDPRSSRINTEMGLIIESEPFNDMLRAAIAPDFERSNAWQLELDDDGDVVWVSDDMTLYSQPAASTWQRLEDWFFTQLPIEDEL